MMPSPIFVFALIIATMCGLGFHVVAGGNARRLIVFVAASWLGFWLGQSIGAAFEIDILKIGVIRLLPAMLSALVWLVLAHLLTSSSARQASRR